jgi:N-acetylmuramoyl-L-alanine amidase CwlA
MMAKRRCEEKIAKMQREDVEAKMGRGYCDVKKPKRSWRQAKGEEKIATRMRRRGDGD